MNWQRKVLVTKFANEAQAICKNRQQTEVQVGMVGERLTLLSHLDDLYRLPFSKRLTFGRIST